MTPQEWAPITFSMGFLEASLDRVSEALIAWVRRRADGREPRVSRVNEPFPDVLRQLEPLTMLSRQRELAIATTGNWTAYFDNGARGTDAASAGRHLTQVAGCRGLAIRKKPHTIGTPGIQRGVAGSAMFELFGPTRGEFLNYVRTGRRSIQPGFYRSEAVRVKLAGWCQKLIARTQKSCIFQHSTYIATVMKAIRGTQVSCRMGWGSVIRKAKFCARWVSAPQLAAEA